MVAEHHTDAELMQWLSAIADPEIPVVTIEEMGMLRSATMQDGKCIVTITPTYSGCPAMGIIEADIKALLHQKGIPDVEVKLVYSPAWTTDWMSAAAKEKMRGYGIAPPLHSSCSLSVPDLDTIACPLCGAKDTSLISRFGSTACKALYKCDSCKEPFEYFKCH